MVRNVLSGMILVVTLTSMAMKSTAQQAGSTDAGDWWLTPHRLLQTNLREIDATMDTDQYVREVKEFGAVVHRVAVRLTALDLLLVFMRPLV